MSRAGNRPANTPARVGNVWVDSAFDACWPGGFDVRAVSARHADAANTLSTAGYAVWGAHAKFDWTGSTSLSLCGRHMGECTHVVYALGSTMVYLDDPRSWELVLRRTF